MLAIDELLQMIVPRDQGRTDSELRHAIITITSRDLREAMAIREMARQTVFTVPRWLARVASGWHPRGGCSHAVRRRGGTCGDRSSTSDTRGSRAAREAGPRRSHVNLGQTWHGRQQ